MNPSFVSIHPDRDPEAWAAYQARCAPDHDRDFPLTAPFLAGPEAPEDMADALPAARAFAVKTVADLAVALDVPEEIVVAVELGRTDPPLDFAKAWLTACARNLDWRAAPAPPRVTVGEQRCGACGHPRALHAAGGGPCFHGRAAAGVDVYRTSGAPIGCTCTSFDGLGFEPKPGGVVQPPPPPAPAAVSDGAQPRRGPHPSTLAIEDEPRRAAAADHEAYEALRAMVGRATEADLEQWAAAGGTRGQAALDELHARTFPEGTPAEVLEKWTVRDLCSAIDLAPGDGRGAFARAANAELARRGRIDPEGVALQVAAARGVTQNMRDLERESIRMWRDAQVARMRSWTIAEICAAIDKTPPEGPGVADGVDRDLADMAATELTRRGSLDPAGTAREVAAARAPTPAAAEPRPQTGDPRPPTFRPSRESEMLAARLRVDERRKPDLRMGDPTMAAILGPQLRERFHDRVAEWAIESTIDELLTAAAVRRDERADEAVRELARRRGPYNATTAEPQPAFLAEVSRQVDVLRRQVELLNRDKDHVILMGRRAPPAPAACPCASDVEEPGPHIPSCPWSDPDYDPDVGAHWRDRIRRRKFTIEPGQIRRVLPLTATENVTLLAPRHLSFKDVVRIGSWLLHLATD